MNRKCFAGLAGVLACACGSSAAIASETPTALENDQLQRLTQYTLDAIQPNGLVRDALTLSPSVPPFHPATPDAAGFALIALCAADHLGYTTIAEQRVEDILRAYSGLVPGVTPQRSTSGHWIRFMNLRTGLYQPGWDDAYSPIGSALIVAGAQFAANHFVENQTINTLADQLQASVDFNDAIHPSLDGRIWLSVGPNGGGDASFGAVSPWNEYMLVLSLALDEQSNGPANAIAAQWLATQLIPKATYAGIETITDSAGYFAPAFWVQQQHYFNADFRRAPNFPQYFENHRDADKAYSAAVFGEAFRYGLTAGVSPTGYAVDRINATPGTFSPAAAGGFGDMDALAQWAALQPPPSNPSYRYGMVRQSQAQPGWVQPDAGLVDRLFLMFGIVEHLEPLFFVQRQFGQVDVDADGIADEHDNCDQFNPDQLDANGNGSGDVCEAVLCRADVTSTGTANGVPDGAVDLSDFSYYLTLWSGSDPAADVTTTGSASGVPDGSVDLSDFSFYLTLWSAGCP